MLLEPTFSTLYDRWKSLSAEGRWNEALEACEELFAWARQSQRPAFFLKAKEARGISAFWCGHFLTSQQDLKEASNIPVAESHGLFPGVNPATLSVCQAYLSLLHAVSLDSKEALDLHHSSIDLAKSSENPLTIAQVMAAESFFHRIRREVAPTLRHANLLKDHCRENGLTFWYSQAGVLAGWAKSLSGDREDGIREMEKHLSEVSSGNFDKLALASLAEGFLVSGDSEQAILVCERAISRSAESGDRFLLSEMWRLMAQLLVQKDRPDGEILQAFERAISIAGEQPSPLFEIRATLTLALWEKGRGRSNPLTNMSLQRLEALYREKLPEEDSRMMAAALSSE